MSALPIVEAILTAAAPVTAIVGTRIFYSVAPQSAPRPYVVLVGTAEDDETLLAGAAQYPESLISVVSYADDFPTVESLGNEIVLALQDAEGLYRGRMASLMRDGGGSFDFLPADRVHMRVDNFSVRHRKGHSMNDAWIVLLFDDV